MSESCHLFCMEEDYNMVIMLVNRLSEKSENGEMKRMSEDELVEQLSDSIRKSNMGLTKSAREVSRSMRDKYAIKGNHRRNVS